MDSISAELLKFGGRKIAEKIHELIRCIWETETMPHTWKKSIVVPIYKKGNKLDCNNYRGISLLPTCYKILSNVLLSRLTLYADEIIGDHQCGFRRNRSTVDQIFTVSQILEKKYEFNQSVHMMFVDFEKA
jgi:hypothetical protein